jgi:HAD superfamily hydrolase (TIGR01509 family)
MGIKGIIFDFDGTILDTEVPFFEVWQETYRLYGYELSLAEWAVSLGTSPDSFDPAGVLQQKIGKSIDREKITESTHQKSLKIIQQLPPIPGVTKFLMDATSQGLKLAVASSSDRPWVVGHLKRLQLSDYFSHICTQEDVKLVKPDPALFLCAASMLALKPSELIVIEDTPHGITAAKTAGMYCIAVPNDLTKHLDIHKADMILESLESISLNDLLDTIHSKDSVL